MKFFLFSDVHCDALACQHIVESARHADIAIGAGDFGLFRKGVKKTIAALAAIGVPTIVVPGNHESHAELLEACDGLGHFHVLHGGSVRINGVVFHGLGGGVPLTPFGPWSVDHREDEAAALLPSGPSGKFCNIQSHCASANQGAFRRQWPLPWQETQHRVALAQRLPKGRATSTVGGVAALGKGLPFPADCALPTMLVARLSVTELPTWPTRGDDDLVLVTHSPPFGCLDALSDGRHVGSHAVRSWIGEKRPRFVVCGHIHEHAGNQGEVAGVPVINAGPRGVEFEYPC